MNSSWIQVAAGRITGADVAAWPYSVGILIRFTSFLNTLHWPSGSDVFGHFGVSFLELWILFDNGLDTGCSVKRLHVRANRPILIPTLISCMHRDVISTKTCHQHLVPQPPHLRVWVGFCLVVLALICPG